MVEIRVPLRWTAATEKHVAPFRQPSEELEWPAILLKPLLEKRYVPAFEGFPCFPCRSVEKLVNQRVTRSKTMLGVPSRIRAYSARKRIIRRSRSTIDLVTSEHFYPTRPDRLCRLLITGASAR